MSAGNAAKRWRWWAWQEAAGERLCDRRVMAAEVVTDLQDYSPGQTALITAWNSGDAGVNFVAGERIRFQVTRTDGIADAPQGNLPWFVTDGVGGFEGYYVDSNGDGTLDYGEFPDRDGVVNAAVSTTWYVEPQYGDSTLRLWSEGLESGATATHDFTDGVNQPQITSPTNSATARGNPGQTFRIDYSATLTPKNSGQNSPAVLSQTVSARIFLLGQGQPSINFAETGNLGTTLGAITGSLIVTIPAATPVGQYNLQITIAQNFADSSTRTGDAQQSNAVIVGEPGGAVGSVTVGSQSGTAIYGGVVDSVAYTVAAIRGSNGRLDGIYGFSGLPAGVTGNLSTTSFTVSGSNAPPTSQITLQVASTVPAGSYSFTVSCVLDGATVSSTGILLVSHAPLTITASNLTKTYGNTFVFDTTAPGDFSTANLFNSDTVTSVTLTSSGAASTASVANAPYTIDISNAIGSGLQNYDITYIGGSMTVGRRPVSFSIGDLAIAYGNMTTFSGLQTTFPTGVDDQTLAITYSSDGNSGRNDVGTYEITGIVTNGSGSLSNYEVTLTDGQLTIDPRPISFSIGDLSIVYGNTTTFSGLQTTFPTGVDDQTLAITYSSDGNSGRNDVGTYEITGIVTNGSGSLSNYEVTLTDGQLTIDPRPVSFIIGNLTKDEGIAFNLASRLPGTILTGIGNQSLSITYASTGAAANAQAGVYLITGNVGDGPDGGLALNYDVTLIPGELAVVLRFHVLGVDANSSTAPYVQVVNSATGTRVSKFLAYESTFTGGVRVVRADLTGDGVEEIITAPGRGRAPEVRVFSLRGAPLTAYNTLAYATSMMNGIQITAGDVNGDGRVDLVTVPSRGPAEVRVFLNQTGTNTDPMANVAWRTFLAFPSTFIGGAVLALADMGRTIGSSFIATPDGKPEILVGSGAGMRATVRVFDAVPATPFLAKTMLFFASTLQVGIASLAVGRVNGNDNIPDVIAGAANGGNAMVEVRDGQTAALLSQFSAYNDISRQAPVRLTTRDTNGDGVIDEIWTAQGTDGKTRQIKRFRVNGAALDSILENDVNFRGEYFLA